MSASQRYRFWVWQNKGCNLLARARNIAGTYITQAAFSGGSITRKVYDLDNSGIEVLSGTLTVATVVFDTLQASAANLIVWSRDGVPVDSTGYNFLDPVPATAFPLGRFKERLYRKYLVEYVFDPASGEDFSLQVECWARDLLSTAN